MDKRLLFRVALILVSVLTGCRPAGDALKVSRSRAGLPGSNAELLILATGDDALSSRSPTIDWTAHFASSPQLSKNWLDDQTVQWLVRDPLPWERLSPDQPLVELQKLRKSVFIEQRPVIPGGCGIVAPIEVLDRRFEVSFRVRPISVPYGYFVSVGLYSSPIEKALFQVRFDANTSSSASDEPWGRGVSFFTEGDRLASGSAYMEGRWYEVRLIRSTKNDRDFLAWRVAPEDCEGLLIVSEGQMDIEESFLQGPLFIGCLAPHNPEIAEEYLSMGEFGQLRVSGRRSQNVDLLDLEPWLEHGWRAMRIEDRRFIPQ